MWKRLAGRWYKEGTAGVARLLLRRDLKYNSRLFIRNFMIEVVFISASAYNKNVIIMHINLNKNVRSE